jgi:plastocyanin
MPQVWRSRQSIGALGLRAPRAGLLLALGALALAGCGLGGPAHQAPSPTAAAAVTMGFESFSPDTVTVRSGDTVEWQNTSPITHTVTDDPKRAATARDSSLPPGGQAFDSGDIPAGQVYLHTFTKPGVYRYFCVHHEAEGMLGTVVVEPAS